MVNHSSSSSTTQQPRGRRRERRQRFSAFLAALASQRTGVSGSAGHDADLDAALRTLVPIRSARLTWRADGPSPESDGRAPGVLRFPVSTPARPGLHLEVDLDPACGLDEWDRQSLRDAARVFGLMVEPRRETVAGSSGRPADRGSPLIGSSACMQHLRGQIAKVAATDFTVLIEGEEIDPQ